MAFKIIKNAEPQESTYGAESLYRVPMQAVKGALTEAAGFAGDYAKTINDLLADPITKHGFGQETVPYEQTAIGKLLPTTEQHEGTINKEVPFLKPRNKLEEYAQDIGKDTAALFLPGRAFRMGRYAFSPMRSLGIAVGANTVGKGVELWSGDKEKGDMAKKGTMLALSLLNPTSAKNISQNLYQDAARALPQNATVNANNFMTRLNNLENRILQGRPPANVAPSERFVLNQIENFRNLVQNGQMSMRTLVAQKRSFNEELQRNLFELPDRASKARARELAQEISHATRDTMRQYGTNNPQWWQLQQSADQAHGAIQQSNFISNVLGKFMKGKPEALSHVFGIGIPAGVAYGSTMGAGAILTGYQSAKIGWRMIHSPELRRHYARVLGAAAADNPTIVHKELDEFQEKLQEKEDKSKNKFKIKR